MSTACGRVWCYTLVGKGEHHQEKQRKLPGAELLSKADKWFRVDAGSQILHLREGTDWTPSAFLALATLVGQGFLVWPHGASVPQSKNDSKKLIKVQRRICLATASKSNRQQRKRSRACADSGRAAGATESARPGPPPAASSVSSSYKTRRRARNTRSDCQAQISYHSLHGQQGNRGSGHPWCLRIVSPYLFTFECAVKARWVGQMLLPMLCSEFVMFSERYFIAAIADGFLKLDDQMAKPTQILKHGTILTHQVLCTEPLSWVRSSPLVLGRHPRTKGDAPTTLTTLDRIDVEVVRWKNSVVLLVNKPAGIPVYPTGAFRHATVSKLLERAIRNDEPLADAIRCKVKTLATASGELEHTQNTSDVCVSNAHIPSLHIVHRLDRLVSGLLIVAVGQRAARQISEQFVGKTAAAVAADACLGHGSTAGLDARSFGAAHAAGAGATLPIKSNSTTHPSASRLQSLEPAAPVLRKQYLACVWGKFPSQQADARSTIVCREPIVQVEATQSKYACGSLESNRGAKAATTHFRLVQFSSTLNVSLVECVPLTGRQHQIRLHLAFLGFPIVNDELYGRAAGGTTKPSARGSSSSLPVDNFVAQAIAAVDQDSKQSVAAPHSLPSSNLSRDTILLNLGARISKTDTAKATALRQTVHEAWISKQRVGVEADETSKIRRLWELRRLFASAGQTSRAEISRCRFLLLHAKRYSVPGSLLEFQVPDPPWVHELFA